MNIVLFSKLEKVKRRTTYFLHDLRNQKEKPRTFFTTQENKMRSLVLFSKLEKLKRRASCFFRSLKKQKEKQRTLCIKQYQQFEVMTSSR